jgi:hypothetical protein
MRKTFCNCISFSYISQRNNQLNNSLPHLCQLSLLTYGVLPGTTPINTRPYTLVQAQKAEIEKQVNKLLELLGLFWTLSIVLYVEDNKSHNGSETGSLSVLRWMGQDKPTKLGPLERASFNQWRSVLPHPPEDGDRSTRRNVLGFFVFHIQDDG